jgi:hypothetical protein
MPSFQLCSINRSLVVQVSKGINSRHYLKNNQNKKKGLRVLRPWESNPSTIKQTNKQKNSKQKNLLVILFTFPKFLLFFCGAGVWTQSLTFLSHSTSTIYLFIYLFIIHMCIQCLGHFSPLPPPPPLPPTPPPPSTSTFLWRVFLR